MKNFQHKDKKMRSNEVRNSGWKIQRHINNSTNGGFTIVETLVAIFILLISITGPMSVAQGGLRAAFVSRDQTTAFYLAQDAVEYVKNIRDDNIIRFNNGSGNDWLDGLDFCRGDAPCTIDTRTESGQIVSCVSDPDTDGCDLDNPLYHDEETGAFGFESNLPLTSVKSVFARTIEIKPFDDPDDRREAEVTVTVRWMTHEAIGERDIVVRELITNWININ